MRICGCTKGLIRQSWSHLVQHSKLTALRDISCHPFWDIILRAAHGASTCTSQADCSERANIQNEMQTRCISTQLPLETWQEWLSSCCSTDIKRQPVDSGYTLLIWYRKRPNRTNERWREGTKNKINRSQYSWWSLGHLWYLASMTAWKYTKSLKNKHNPPRELIKVTAAKIQIFAFNTFKT